MMPLHDLGKLLVEQRLAAGDRDHRRAAFIDGCKAVGHRQALVEDFVGIVDLAAAGAGEIAAEQRLEHEHERIALAAGQMLPDHIGADEGFLQKRDSQDGLLPFKFMPPIVDIDH